MDVIIQSVTRRQQMHLALEAYYVSTPRGTSRSGHGIHYEYAKANGKKRASKKK